MSRRFAIIAGISAASALVLVSCSCKEPAPPSPQAAEGPAEGGTLVVAVPGDVHSFNPLVARGSRTMDVLEHLFPCLVTAEFDGRLRFGPGLAESWALEGTELTLRLRDDLTWQDGEPIDAADLIFTLEASSDPATGSPRLATLDVLRDSDPWEQRDARTVVLHFDEPGRPETLLAGVARGLVVPEHALAPIPRDQLRTAEFGTQPVAAGPYLLERWNRGEQIVLRRREGAPAYIDRVVLRVIEDPTTRRMAYVTGDADLLLGVDVDDVREIADARPESRIVRRGYRNLEFVAWNLRDDRFGDVRLRRALAHAVDVDALLEVLLTEGDTCYGRRAVGTITPALKGAADESIVPLPHDRSIALDLLAKAGWEDADGDGIRERDGIPLRFELMYAADDRRRQLTAEILRAQLAEVGVRVEPTPLERRTVFERLRAREFEAVVAGWGAGLAIDPSPVWHSSRASEFNFVGYANPAVDAAIDRGLAARDDAAADAAWQQMQRLIYADQPYLFLFWVDDLAVLAPHVRDAEIGLLGAFHHLDRWWLDAGQQPSM